MKGWGKRVPFASNRSRRLAHPNNGEFSAASDRWRFFHSFSLSPDRPKAHNGLFNLPPLLHLSVSLSPCLPGGVPVSGSSGIGHQLKKPFDLSFELKL